MDEKNTNEPIEAEVVSSQTTNTTQNADEKAPAGLKVLSFFIPLAGLILFCVNYSDKPRYAKGCGICALIGFFTIPLAIFLFVMLILVAVGVMVFNTAQNVGTTPNTSSSSYTAQAVETFNGKFENYQGSQTYTGVRTLMSIVTNSNYAYDDMQVSVKLDGKSMTPTEVRTSVKSGKRYYVSFGYDYSGFIDEIRITEN